MALAQLPQFNPASHIFFWAFPLIPLVQFTSPFLLSLAFLYAWHICFLHSYLHSEYL